MKKKEQAPKTYDIEEYRRKKKREKWLHRLLRVGALLLILSAIVGGIYLYQRYDLEQLLKNAAEGTGTNNPTAGSMQTTSFPVALDAVEPIDILSFGDSVVLLTSDETALLDASGKTSFQFVHGFTNPVVKTGNDRVLTYDRGGYGFRLDSRQGNLYAGRTSNTILTGASGHGAVFALVTTEPHYAGSVTVYNKVGEELLKWSSSDSIVDVAFSPDDSRLAVACVSFDTAGDLVAAVHVLDIRKEEEVAAPSVIDAIPVAVDYKKDGEIHLVCDSLLAVVDKELKNGKTVGYSRQLQGYAFSETETVLSTSDSHEVESTLLIVSSEGELRSQTVRGSVKDLSAESGNICLLTASDVRKYDGAGALTESDRISNSVFKMELSGGQIYILSKSYLDVLKPEEETSSVGSEGIN